MVDFSRTSIRERIIEFKELKEKLQSIATNNANVRFRTRCTYSHLVSVQASRQYLTNYLVTLLQMNVA